MKHFTSRYCALVCRGTLTRTTTTRTARGARRAWRGRPERRRGRPSARDTPGLTGRFRPPDDGWSRGRLRPRAFELRFSLTRRKWPMRRIWYPRGSRILRVARILHGNRSDPPAVALIRPLAGNAALARIKDHRLGDGGGACEDDVAMPAAVARGFGGDLHGGEGAGIGGAPHLDGSGAGAADGEGAGGDQLGVAGPTTNTRDLSYDCGDGVGATVPDRSAPTWTVQEGHLQADPVPSPTRVAVVTAYHGKTELAAVSPGPGTAR